MSAPFFLQQQVNVHDLKHVWTIPQLRQSNQHFMEDFQVAIHHHTKLCSLNNSQILLQVPFHSSGNPINISWKTFKQVATHHHTKLCTLNNQTLLQGTILAKISDHTSIPLLAEASQNGHMILTLNIQYKWPSQVNSGCTIWNLWTWIV